MYQTRMQARESAEFIKNWAQLRLHALLGRPIRILIGASDTSIDGWVITQQRYFDLLNEAQATRFMGRHSATSILLEHVLEHLTEDEAYRALRLLVRFLLPGGNIRIAVPDGLHPSPEYQRVVGLDGPDGHKVLWTYSKILRLGSVIGTRVELLEYFDEDGHFHSTYCDDLDGAISRCAAKSRYRLDHFRYEPYGYTSLIVDMKLSHLR